ncbi:MAG: hypothetical protein KDA42_04755, partial [Planctomycetales bacterium]|nr:hypothetical protein [Planctomycetales bacterium]
TGLSTDNPRQQINSITAWLDGSVIYGSDPVRAAELRALDGTGRLKTSDGDLLPFNTAGLDNAGGPSESLFLAGDVRANENAALTAMQTLWVREHNYWADQIAADDSSLTGDQIYERARAIVTAEMQAITYNEFLPALLGSYAPSAADYNYNAGVNAGIANEFSTALYRVGHSMLTSEIQLSGDGGQYLNTISLDQAFFSPSQMMSRPKLMEEILMGLAMQQAQEIDTRMVDDVRNFLFAPNGSMGLDLAALNLQRGRDHGLPDYNTLREAYGLPRVDEFSDITSDASLQALLAVTYDSVDNIDAWIGALAEDHVGDASVGLLLATALGDQFSRLRDGDRFFYSGDALLNSPDVLSLVDFSSVDMMNLLAWNTAMKDMPQSFFMAVPEPSALALLTLLAALPAVRRR